MEIQVLGDKVRNRASGVDFCHLVGAIGTPLFETALLQLATRAARCTHLNAFSTPRARAPRALVAVNRGNAPVARRLASKYISEYWTLDPINDVLDANRGLGLGATIRMHPHEIADTAYRRDCYSAADLIDRLSIVKAVGDDLIRVNFYRERSDGRFTDAELDDVAGMADLLLQIVGKHDALRSPDKGEDQYALLCQRLSLCAPHLSPREIQVCTEIVLGLSSEGIASKLALSINTILSHRKRAYAKLNISSQNELSYMVLH